MEPAPAPPTPADERAPAGFWIRFGAYIIDGIVLMAVNAALTGLASLAAEVDPVSSFLMSTLMSAAYFTWMLAAFRGQTLGKMAAGIAAVREDGASLSYSRSFGRWCAYWVSTLTLFIGFIIAAFTDRKRALHDFIADTRVVYVRPIGTLRKAAVIGSPFLLLGVSFLVGAASVLMQPGIRKGFTEGFGSVGKSIAEGGKAAMEEGHAFGQGKATDACLGQAVAKLQDCDGILCEVDSKFFLRSCLQAASPSDGFCDGVPGRDSILGTVGWRISTCTGLGAKDNNSCGRLLEAVQEHCHPKKGASRAATG